MTLLLRGWKMADSGRYDAFISYRHCQPDSLIAERLQKKLENFRLPKDIAKKTGRTKLDRVFRDETELAVADDLSEAIEEALRNSDYLIAICSPAYLGSPWCMKEVEAFRNIRGQKRILLVLADGEPEDAFPEVLLYEDTYTIGPDWHQAKVRRAREPLAADCRGESDKERNAKVDTAVLRLVAVILGIGYDDLAQRQRKEQNIKRRRLTLTALGILTAIILICVFFLISLSKQKAEISRKNDEISMQNQAINEQNKVISRKYSDSLAAASDNLLRDGRRKDAIFAARTALSDGDPDFFSEPASKALANALGIYDPPDTLSCDDSISLPCSLSGFVISPNGGYAGVSGLGDKGYVVDMNSGATVFSLENADYNCFAFDGENGVIFKSTDSNYRYYDIASSSETDLGVFDAEIITNPGGNGYAVVTYTDAVFYKGTTPVIRMEYSDMIPDLGPRCYGKVLFSMGGDEAWILISDFDALRTYTFHVDLNTGIIEQFDLNGNGLILDAATDGVSMIWTQNDGLYTYISLRDVKNGGETYTISPPESTYGFAVCGSDAVVYTESLIYIMDSGLNTVKTVDNTMFISKSFASPDGVILLEQGRAFFRIHNGDYAYYDPDVYDVYTLCESQYVNGDLYLSGAGENYINVYSQRTSDHLVPYSGEYRSIDSPFSGEPESEAFKALVTNSNPDIDPNDIYNAVLCENANIGAICFWDGKVTICDSNTGEVLKTVYSFNGFVRDAYYDSVRELYYFGADSIEIFDKDLRNIASLKDCSLLGIDNATGNPVIIDYLKEEQTTYLADPVTTDEMKEMADELLGDYVPDEKILEQYGL